MSDFVRAPGDAERRRCGDLLPALHWFTADAVPGEHCQCGARQLDEQGRSRPAGEPWPRPAS